MSAINGAAVGAGLCLALASDLRIASKDAKMGVTFSSLGFHPGKYPEFFEKMKKIIGLVKKLKSRKIYEKNN